MTEEKYVKPTFIDEQRFDIKQCLGKGKKGPCMFMEMESTEPEILDIIGELFALVPKGNDEITKYLQKELDAPDDIRERALKIASTRNEPRFKG